MRNRFLPAVAVAISLLFAAGGLAACDDDAGDSGDNGAPPAPRQLQFSDADSGKTASADVGSTIVVALTSNASTGFAWRVHEALPPQLEQVGDVQYVPPGSTQPVAGAAGTEVFTFRAASAGTAELALDYARSADDGAPASTYAVTIEIE
jgi:predicted secreted protein